MTDTPEEIEIAIIGAGPAGLMAAETLIDQGHKPVLFDAMPTPARKFLMAGKSGLNLSHNEPIENFITRYGKHTKEIEPAVHDFPPSAVQAWADGLGAHTFVGSSGRIFPKAMKASPLLRAWLQRIFEGGVTLNTLHKWTGWDTEGCLTFCTREQKLRIKAKATILALGGTSWPKLGSDGTWQSFLTKHGLKIAPFSPSNCGFLVDWSPYFKDRFAGEPIKGALLSAGKTQTKGDFVISQYGVEGSAIYSLSAPLRDFITINGSATLTIDLTPDRTHEQITKLLSKPRGKKSFATHLKRTLGLTGVKANILRECLPSKAFESPETLASGIKSLPIKLTAPRPIEEAISVAGGLSFNELDEHLMIKSMPGVFAAGEMLDWEAPTGGYLLTACLAQGRQAAIGVDAFLKHN